jgi:hypothetical protein
MSMNEVKDEAFTEFLAWLDPCREAAGQKYRQLHARLVALFGYWRCADPEGLTDATLGRASRKVAFFRNDYRGDPWAYIRGIAWNVRREDDKARRRLQSLDDSGPPLAAAPEADPDLDAERALACLEKCRAEVLSAEEARLVAEYYGEADRIARRKALAEGEGITQVALRKRSERYRRRLGACIQECLAQAGPSRNRGR